MKNLKIICITLLAITLIPFSVFADGPRELVIGSFNYYPVIFKDKVDGVVKGFFVDIIEEIAKKENWTITYKHGTFADQMKGIQNGELDLISGVVFTEEREKFLDYNTEPVIIAWTQVFSHKDSNITDILTIRNKKIGTMLNDHNGRNFREHTKSLGIDCTFVTYPDFETLLAAIDSGKVAAGVFNSMAGIALAGNYNNIEMTSITLNPVGSFYAAPQGDLLHLLPHIDKHLKEWIDEDNTIYHEKLDFWLHKDITIRNVIPQYLMYSMLGTMFCFIAFILITIGLRKIISNRTKELEDSKERLKASQRMAKIGNWVQKISKEELIWSDETYRIFGIPKDHEGSLWDAFMEAVHPDDRDTMLNSYLESVATKTPYDFVHRALMKDGSIKYVREWCETEYNKQNSPITSVGTVQDITEQVLAKKDKENLQADLIQVQKMEALGTLSGGIAHDFNNILAGIVGYTELISINTEPVKLERYTERILAGAERAANLVQQILLFSAKTRPKTIPIRIYIALNEVLNLLKATIPKAIKLDIEIESNAYVLADPTQIHQVIMNLCTNAVYSMKEMSGTLKIRLYDKNGHVCLDVTDTGIGIPEEILPKIFDPYFTTKPKGKGTGLGLSVVHGIITNYGGNIEVESIQGKGTTFKIILPITKELPIKIMSKEPLEELCGLENIMIVDDEESIRKVSSTYLKRCGYTVHTFKDGLDALHAYKLAPTLYDIIVTDISMPVLDGIAMAKEILTINPNIPIIVTTGNIEPLTKGNYEELGISKCLDKPVSLSDLLKEIRDSLDSRVLKEA